MRDGKSEIDDNRFFLSVDGKTNAKAELHATLDGLFDKIEQDENSTTCKFPARFAWLKDKLNLTDLPNYECSEYNKIFKRLNPKSATLIFPSAHINSPASMFGHTFLRVNSAYKSKLLSFAINYAADANPDNTDALTFAIKGLFGGYNGRYSLLPYYEKLKEYRDTEQRDIWEYDLNLSESEVEKIVMHMWELNNIYSNYYFFTENCSYNILWLLEVARPSIHLKEHFNYQVTPMETIHVSKLENIIKKSGYRPSKRTVLLKYEELINDKYIDSVSDIIDENIEVKDIVNNKTIDLEQKKYILEASIEFLEYSFSKNSINKNKYLELFHTITKARASLGLGKKLNIKTPPNPIDGHRAVRVTTGIGYRENERIGFLGIRPAYHDIEDSNYGFLRGTQIEFLNFLISYNKNKAVVENATILSIASLAQRSNFFDSFSWRTKFGFDRDYIDNKSTFISTVGFGYSWGNKLAYIYIMADPLFYVKDRINFAIGGSIGLSIDTFSFMSANIEVTDRFYDTGERQLLSTISQNFRVSQNVQLGFKYKYKKEEETFKAILNYYF